MRNFDYITKDVYKRQANRYGIFAKTYINSS